MNASQAELASAQATYANAKADAARARSLAPQKFVSKSDVDAAEAAERTAAAAVQQAQASLANAKINLGYARSPRPSPAAPASSRSPKARWSAGRHHPAHHRRPAGPLFVNFSMSSDELTQLRRAQAAGAVSLSGDGKSTVQVKLSDGTMYDQPGTLDYSSAVVDPSTGAVTLRAVLPNPQQILLPGAFVSFGPCWVSAGTPSRCRCRRCSATPPAAS